MRKHWLLAMMMLALFLTLSPTPDAQASDFDAALMSNGNYVIVDANLNGSVELQASGDCTLFVGLYSKNGKMRELQTKNVEGKSYYRVGSSDTYSVEFDNAVESGDYTLAFLLDSATLAPLCSRRASPEYNDFPIEQYALIEDISFDVPSARLRFADGSARTVTLDNSGDNFTEDNFSARRIVRYSVENGVYTLYSLADDDFHANDNFGIKDSEMHVWRKDSDGTDIYYPLLYVSRQRLRSIFADSETRFVIQQGDVWTTYVGMENVPDVFPYTAHSYIYHHYAGLAKLVFVYTED